MKFSYRVRSLLYKYLLSVHGWIISTKWERFLFIVILIVNFVLFYGLQLLGERRLLSHYERVRTHVNRIRILFLCCWLGEILSKDNGSLQFRIIKVIVVYLRSRLLLNQLCTTLLGWSWLNRFCWWFFLLRSLGYNLESVCTSAIKAW